MPSIAVPLILGMMLFTLICCVDDAILDRRGHVLMLAYCVAVSLLFVWLFAELAVL